MRTTNLSWILLTTVVSAACSVPAVGQRVDAQLVPILESQGEVRAAADGAIELLGDRGWVDFALTVDAAGRYRIDAIPIGQYVPAAVAPRPNASLA